MEKIEVTMEPAIGLSKNDFGLILGKRYYGKDHKLKTHIGICVGEISSFVTLKKKNGRLVQCHINTVAPFEGLGAKCID